MTTKTIIQEATFTVYWQKYISPPKISKQSEREALIETRMRRTEQYKSPKQDISEYDSVAYF